MNTRKKLFVISLIMLIGTADVSAQGILGNLAKKGIETLKKTPTKVADALVGSKEEIEASKKKKGDKDETPPGKKGKSTSTGNPNPDGHGEGAGPWSGPPSVEIDFDGFCWECVSPSYDGIFCIPVGSTGRYRFYKTDGGKRVGNSEWKASSEPHFNKGVCAVKSATSRKWYILKASGDSIALDTKITEVTNFMDGVAVARTSYTDCFFINDKGQRVYPNVKPSDCEIYPLIDGTRRMFRGKNGYGYIDAHGNVVIQPQYSEARNFSGGLAIVYDMTATHEKYWVINTMGKKVSEVPKKYASYSWTHHCNMSDFISSGAVAKNDETGKYDIIDPEMRVIASFDDASPFCLKTMPSTAAVCIVKNKDWDHPQFCKPSGSILREYNDPSLKIVKPTQPWIETQNDKGEKTVRMPFVLRDYELTFPAKEAWVAPRWEYTGYNIFKGSLTNDVGYIMDYEGVIRTYNWKYEKPDVFSMDGYAKAIKKSTRGWRKQVSTWIEDLDDHMVFIDPQGTVMVEIIDKPKE